MRDASARGLGCGCVVFGMCGGMVCGIRGGMVSQARGMV